MSRIKWDFWRRSGNGQPLLPGPGAVGSADKLKAAFYAATFGRSCRTITYVSAAMPDRTEWMEACAVNQAEMGWSIFRKGRDSAHFNGTPVVAQKEVVKNLTFFDAIEYLARYEATQIENGFLPAQVDESAALGLQHFMGFARREGIVFDIGNMPHPTSNGRIVTDGVFPETDYAGAEQAMQEKNAFFLADVTDFMDPALFRQKRKDAKKLQSVLSALQAVHRTMKNTSYGNTDDKDDTSWFIEEALSGTVKFNPEWQKTAEWLSWLIDQRWTEMPDEIVPVLNRATYDLCVFHAANILYQGNIGRHKKEHALHYSAAFAQKAEKRVVKFLEAQGFAGDAQQKAFREIQICLQDIESKGQRADIVLNIGRAIHFTKQMIAYTNQEMGIHQGGDVLPRPVLPQI